MARPAKSSKVSSHHSTKAEKSAREDMEAKLRGHGEVCIEPPDYLNEEQRRIFCMVRDLLLPIGMLNNGDVFMLSHLAVAVEREAYIDKTLNEGEGIGGNSIMMARDRYDKQFLRCCTELCLSPAARAKISVAAANAQKEKSDPLVAALDGGGK